MPVCFGPRMTAKGPVGQWGGFVGNDGEAWAGFAWGIACERKRRDWCGVRESIRRLSRRRISSRPEIFKTTASGNGETGLFDLVRRDNRYFILGKVVPNIG